MGVHEAVGRCGASIKVGQVPMVNSAEDCLQPGLPGAGIQCVFIVSPVPG